MTTKNQILFGPPGTGKTYAVVERTLAIVDPEGVARLKEQKSPREDWTRLYQSHVEANRIQFCTFHQSFSYEDFVEGLRSDGKGGFEPKNGIFKQICTTASHIDSIKKTIAQVASTIDVAQRSVYKMSLGQKQEEKIFEYCLNESVIALGYGSQIDFTDCNNANDITQKIHADGSIENIDTVSRTINMLKFEIQIGDMIIASHGNHNFRAIGIVTGDYYYDSTSPIPYAHFRKVDWIFHRPADSVIPAKELFKNNFVQIPLYPLSQEVMKVEKLPLFLGHTPSSTQDILPGNVVLVIDEINRGNISRIFGELITLIEDDKRRGAMNEITVTLPYSQELFSVPANLHILGTMNTADRSITLMDTALRRRFEFTELLPDPDLLPQNIEGVDVRQMLIMMNERIEYLYDRDHTIGHGFFLNEHLTIESLIHIMQKKIIPLLQEYFYDDFEKIALVLRGATNDSDDSSYFLCKKTLQAQDLFPNHSGLREEKIRYEMVPNPSVNALRRIYE